MPKATVKIYDANDNLVEELPYGKNGITGVETNNQRQQVYQDIDKDGNKIFVASEGFSDPFARAGSEITQMVSIQAPKVKIDGNKLVVQASKDVMPTPIVAQIKEELQSLKGSDLSSPEVKRAIDALNEEISTNLEDTMLKSSLGWTKDQYNDYQYIRQTVSRSNPMSSSNKIKGKDKEGKIIMKTPQEWIDYYRSAYNVDERTDAYKKSFTATDPYDRTMALVMGQGKAIPVYGFDAADRNSQGWKALENQMGKFHEGTFRFFAEDNDTKRVEGIVKNKNIPVESMRKFNINNEDQFAAKKESLKGKSWGELSDDDKAFLVLLGVSREGELERNADTSEAMKDYRGKKTNTFAWETNKQDYERAERKAAREIGTSDLNGAISDDEETSRAAIDRILSNNSFDKYRTARNNYDTWQGYEDWSNAGEKELQNTAFWSGNEQAIGNIAGTIGRFLWEDAVLRGLTGGIGGGGVSMNAVSDAIGNKIVGKLASHGIAPTSKIGRGLLQFSANLVGTIPEDILQTSVDNVLTYNIDENTHLLNPEEMSDNLRNNLIFMSLFNAARAGISSIKKARILKKLEKAADLNQKINIGGVKADADDIARAVENGGAIKVDGDKVSVVDVDGKETVLKNTTPEQAEMVQRSLFDYAIPDLDKGELKAGDKIEFETTYGGRQRWFDGEVVEENGKLKIRGEGYEDIDVDANEVYRVRRRIGDNGAFDQEGTNKATTEPKTEPETVKVEVDTPDGPVRVDTVDYRFRNIDDATDPNVKVESSPAGVKHWHRRALEAIMRSFRDNLAEFRNRFGDVRASDFDWVYYNTRKGLTPEQIIGTTDPTTGRTVNQNMIDAMRWWSEQSFTKKLRTGSREALGLEGDFDTLGYLPHTSYDPSSLSYDEAVAGQLWKKFTGKSVIKDGRYVGYGGTLDGRYRTFASNMLWDMRNKEVAAAKLIEEAQLEGKTLSPEQAMKAVEGGQNIQKSVNESPSTKKLTKKLSSSKDDVDWKEIDKNVKEEGQKSGLSKAIHDNYQDVYSGANSAQVVSQPGAISEGLSQQSDIMKKIRIGNGMSMYDYGGADIVYASQNAIELVNRFMRDGGDFKQLLVNYIEQHSHRSPKYADAVADRWIAKMNSAPGEMTKGKAIVELSSSMRSEAMSRLRKFLVMADYNGKVGVDGKRVGGFNDSTKKFIDDFLFRHMQMENIKNNPSISKMVTGALNGLTGLRYRALFYGNFKNALLQVSELNRLFTVFKWGDVGQTLKKLATDGDFRARVDTYVEAVSPETTFLDSEVYGKYGKLADSAEVGEDGITFNKIKDGVDDIALAPINKAEAIKNRTMIAALVQEADRMGLSGDEALRHIRSRFERVALANNEMGRIGLSSNRLAKPMLFLQNFQIRELGMHYYNIKDATGVGKSLPKKVLDATKYLTKVFGAKLATTLILARLGYSASQTLGFDPFGLADKYNKLDEDEMNVIDKQISGGVLTPFFAGGMTSLVSDMYFMARKAYEDSVRETISDEAEANLNDEIGGGADWSAVFSPDYMLGLGAGFVPGNVFLNRIGQMNEMMDTGWATSSTGNKMYAAPNDTLNTILGYLFGRSATQNALQYNQSYGDDIGQTISRTLGKTLSNMFGGGYQQFDPIDTKNYSDWFKGDEGDQQQFNKGLRYFRQQRDNILGAYNDAINKSWSSDDEIAEAKNDMNVKLDELYNSLERFVSAYENKNGTIDSAMAKQIITVLNTGQEVLEDDSTQRNERGLGNNSKALERYANLGLSPVGTYSGAYGEGEHAEDEVKYQGSPQWRIAKGAKYDLRSEAAAVLRAGDATLEDLRKGYKDKISAAYDNKDYDELERIQKEYLTAFDKVVGPIMATYGNGILSNGDVVEELTEMLSVDSGKNADFIPRDDWTLGTNNRWLSTKKYPIAGVDVKKWLKERYSNDIYKTPTVRSYSTAQDDIDEIKRLSAQGKPDRARARALQLKVRVDNQVRSLSNNDYKWLLDFLNNGGK